MTNTKRNQGHTAEIIKWKLKIVQDGELEYKYAVPRFKLLSVLECLSYSVPSLLLIIEFQRIMIGFNTIKMISRSGALLTIVIGLTACTQSPLKFVTDSWSKKSPEAAPQMAEPELPEQMEPKNAVSEELTADMLYQVLLGEIAGQRGQLAASGASYLQAARSSNDPRIAERALKISIYAKHQEPAYQAAQRWVELAPDNLEARQALAALALRIGKQDEALKQFDYLLEHQAKDQKDPYQSMLVLFAREPDKERALGVMSGLVDLRPDDAHAHFAYARLAVNAQKWAIADTQLYRCLELKPDWVAALVLHAQVQLKQEQNDLARSQLESAISRNPKAIDLRFAYARLLVDVKDLDEARVQYKKILKQRPDNEKVVYSLALLSLEAGQLKETEKLFKRQLKLNYLPQQAYYYLGAIAEEQKKLKRAFEWYEKVEKGDHWLDVQIRMARIEADAGDVKEARDRLRQIRLKYPQNAQRLYLVEGGILSSIEWYEEAFKLYSYYLQSQPDDAEILYARSLIAERLDRIDVAEADLRTVLKTDPENTRALNALGYTLADRTDRYEEALGYVERALKQTPKDPAVIDSMGWVLYKLGRLAQARDYLQQAYDDTSDAEIAAHLGEVMWAMDDRDAARSLWKKARKAKNPNKVLEETVRRYAP